MTKEDQATIAGTYEDNYFAVIDEHGVIQYANDPLANCIHIESRGTANLFFNYISPIGATQLKNALQHAGYAANPFYLRMDLFNSSVHKANWHIAKLKTATQRPEVFICIGSKTNIEKPTNTPVTGLLVTDAQGNVLDANDQAASFLNTNPESLLNAQLADFCSPLKIFSDPISYESTPPMKALLSGKA